MKKIFLLFAVSLLLITGCKKENNITKMSLKSILKASTKGAKLPDNYITKITKDNLIAFMKSNSNYEVKNTLSHTKAKTLVLVGSKERPIMKKSATKIVHLIPNSELEALQGYYHGDSVIIDSNQNVIIVIMDEKNNADTIHNNFKNIK